MNDAMMPGVCAIWRASWPRLLDFGWGCCWGASDPTFPESRARQMVPQFPNVAGFHAIADARLFVHEERPAEVSALIGDFLSSPGERIELG